MQIRKTNSFRIIVFLLMICCSSIQTSLAQGGIEFSFKLGITAKTSAGVFLKDGTLVRTLWSGVKYTAGVHKYTWDGVDDEGHLSADGSYVVKVLSNNVSYKWEGVIGNTSDSLSGPSVYHALDRMYDMAISGDNAYFATGYNEQNSSSGRFNIRSPQKKITILDKGLGVKYVATDGKNVYWAGNDAVVPNNWMVFGTQVTNDLETSFDNGSPQATKYGHKYKSAIDQMNNYRSDITGLAVQKRGLYLFVAHSKLNEVHVLNKTTGSLVQTLTFDSPANIITDTEDNIWLFHEKDGKRIIEKFTVGPDGKLLSQHIIPQGLAYPLAAAASPAGKTLVVADGGDSQQLKAFRTNDGTQLWTYGIAGGYATDPNVNNNKFYFRDFKGPGTFIAFQPDNSFWVEDSGNSRAQHYAADRTFINRIMYVPLSYSAFADSNNPNRVFSDYLEFKIDYSKPLAANNGSWELVRNWGYNIPDGYDDKYNRLRGVATLSNGKTYALMAHRGKPVSTWKVVELPATGPMRITRVDFPVTDTQLYPDGSLRILSRVRQGMATIFTKKELLKFDENNDPEWGPETAVAQTQPAQLTDPGYRGNSTGLRSGELTSAGVMVLFDASLSKGWHLGGVSTVSNKLLWRTAMSTTKEYSGPFPSDGAFDIGNNVKNAGSTALASGHNIFWGYHGEFWKGSQVNKWTHVYDDGLFVGQFGVSGREGDNTEAALEMAGNSFSASVVKLARGDTYLYTNDESVHGGVHRWKINGLSTINEQIVPVDFAATAHGLSAKKILAGAGNLMSYTGYVNPLYSEQYNFYLKGDNAEVARLWVDGKLMGSGENTLETYLTKGMRYPVRLEYPVGLNTGKSFQLFWKSEHQAEQIIPDNRLYYLKPGADSLTIQLMDDLPFNSTLEDGRYGWNRDPAVDDLTDKYKKLWSVHTNIKTYRRNAPDIYIDYRQQNKRAVLSRDFGSYKNLSLWTLTGVINFTPSCINIRTRNKIDENNAVYLELLDNAKKVIARVLLSAPVYKGNVSLLVNETTVNIFKNDDIKKLEDRFSPITIKMINGRLMATYSNNTPVPFKLMDNTADAKSPASMRVVCSSLNKFAIYTLGLDAWTFEPKK